MYDGFRKYQAELLGEFDKLAKEYNFEVIDATPDARSVFERLRAGVARVLSGEPREPLFSVPTPLPEAAEPVVKKALEMPAPAKPLPAAVEETPLRTQALAKAVEGEARR
jgi:hypothetical protein